MSAMRLLALLMILGLLAACVPAGPIYPPPVPKPPEPGTVEPKMPGQKPGEVGPGQGKPAQPPEAPTDRKPESQWPPDVPRTASQASGTAVMALLRKGSHLAAAGHYRRASATIERAITIEPRNPFIFQRLAELRLKQGQAHQAEALARKSNSLGQNNPWLRADNWSLIARALRAQGKVLAAESAAGQASYLRSRLR